VQGEGSIATLTAQRTRVDAEMAAAPSDNRLVMRRANLDRDIAYLETQWLEIGTALEAAESSSAGTP
jgi:hypothetical protein